MKLALALLAVLATPAFAANRDDDADLQRALRSLQILGADVDGSSGRCSECHNLSQVKLYRWKQQTQELTYSCLYQPDDQQQPVMSARERIDCMRSERGNPNSPFAAERMGIYAAGAHLPYFQNLFEQAFPADEWRSQYDRFKNAVGMPLTGANTLSGEEFADVLDWTKEGMPAMERLLAAPVDVPTQCVDSVSEEMKTHVRRMQMEGWASKNAERGLTMFGCSAAGDPLACFNQRDANGNAIFPEARDLDFARAWTVDMPIAKARILREITFRTSYWMRSSADGRFFANGNDDGENAPWAPADAPIRFGGMISDLNTQLTGAPFRDIPVAAAYDPTFFPDNSGFVFQATPLGAGHCNQSLIENPETTQITFNESACSGSGFAIRLYQSVGASLDGSDYLAVAGSFESDGGSGYERSDRAPGWLDNTYLTLTPLIHDGTHYVAQEPMDVWTPYLGDFTVSPSNLVIASRIAGKDAAGEPKQMGYRFQLLRRNPLAVEPATLTDVGTFCQSGGKGNFSFDERLYAVFHYVAADDWRELGYASAEDPEFRELLRQGTANIYVVDLLTGAKRRVTRMGAGQFALFPHFRSDGWLYFMVLDKAHGDKRYAAATDAGIHLMREQAMQ